MTRRNCIITTPIACLTLVAAAIAGITILWAPLHDFPTSYSYQKLPGLVYEYDSGVQTATCSATSVYFDEMKWACRGGTNPTATRTTQAASASTSTATAFESAVLDDIQKTVSFFLVSTVGGSTYEPLSWYGANYFSTSLAPTVTRTDQASSTVASSASGRYSATRTSSRSVYDDGAYSSSQTAISSLLRGSVIAQITSAPTPSTFLIHLPRPTQAARIAMTVYQGLGITLALIILLQSGINLFISRRFLKRAQEEAATTQAPHTAAFLEYLAYTRREPDGQVITDDDGIRVFGHGYDQEKEDKAGIVAAWKMVPRTAIGGPWMILFFFAFILGVVSIGTQALNLKHLPEYVEAGACGQQQTAYPGWERVICRQRRPDKSLGTYTLLPGEPVPSMRLYAWPLTVTLAMFAIEMVCLVSLLVSLVVRMKHSTATMNGPGLSTTTHAGGIGGPIWFPMGADSGGGGSGWGGGDGGGGCGGGGGDGGGGGGGGDGGGGGCC